METHNTERLLRMTELILRRPKVEEIVGLSRSTIYDMISKNLFPRPIKLGVRAVGWRESAISDWLQEREKQSFDNN